MDQDVNLRILWLLCCHITRNLQPFSLGRQILIIPFHVSLSIAEDIWMCDEQIFCGKKRRWGREKGRNREWRREEKEEEDILFLFVPSPLLPSVSFSHPSYPTYYSFYSSSSPFPLYFLLFLFSLFYFLHRLQWFPSYFSIFSTFPLLLPLSHLTQLFLFFLLLL